MVAVLVPATMSTLADTLTGAGVSIALVSPATIAALPTENVHVAFAVTAAGDPVPRGTSVRVAIHAGPATFSGATSIDAVTDADGHVDVVLQPQAVPAPITLAITCGKAVTSIDLDIIEPPSASSPPAIVVGVATVGAGSVPGTIEAPDNAPDGTLARRGAVSIYASGSIAKNTTASVAYATANTLDQTNGGGAFVDNPDARPFPIYGDSSTRFDDALSRTHLYAHVQSGASSATYGEFTARGGAPDANGGYSVLANGTQVTLRSGGAGLTGFTSTNNVAYGRIALSPTGLGIADQTLHPDIVAGSDVATLVSIDRRTGAVDALRVLNRGTDYVLDTATGALRFVDVFLPYDAAGNPQTVIVQYEYTGSGAQTALSGASATARMGAHGARVDGWYLNNATGAGDLSITGEALRGGSPAAAWNVSHEHTQGIDPTGSTSNLYGAAGDTYHARFAAHGGPLSVDVAFDTTSAAYQNPFGAFTTPGLTALRATASQRLSRVTSLDLTYADAKNIVPQTPLAPAVDNADAQAALKINVRPNARLRYHAGVVDAATTGTATVDALTGQTQPAPVATFAPFTPPAMSGFALYTSGSGHAVLADTGAAWDVARGVTLDANRLTQLSTSSDPYEPAATELGLTVATSPDEHAFLRQSWQSASVNALAATQANATFAGSARSTTSAGLEQRIGDTTLESGYAVDNTANGMDLYEAIGARRTFHFSPNLSGDGFVQTGQSLTALAAAPATPLNFFVAGASAAYTTHVLSASGQLQLRTGYNSGSSFSFGATGPLTDSLSIFGSTAADYTPSASSTRSRGGLAFRPAENDRSVTLLTIDSESGNLYTTDGYVTNVAQLQELYRPSSLTELAASLAYKISGDSTFAPRTTIYGLRADQRFGSRFDVAAEVHQSATAPIDGASATGLAVEAGVRVGGRVRVAAGYNFSGFADPAAAVSPTHRGLYATISTFVDRLFGWGKRRSCCADSSAASCRC